MPSLSPATDFTSSGKSMNKNLPFYAKILPPHFRAVLYSSYVLLDKASQRVHRVSDS